VHYLKKTITPTRSQYTEYVKKMARHYSVLSWCRIWRRRMISNILLITYLQQWIKEPSILMSILSTPWWQWRY